MNLYDALLVFVLHLYAFGTVSAVGGIISPQTKLKKAALWLTAAAFIGNTACLILNLTAGELTRSFSLQLLSWLMVLGCLAGWFKKDCGTLAPIGLPLTLVIFTGSAVLAHVASPWPPYFSGTFFLVHLLCMIVSLGLVSIGFGASVLFLIQNRRLKRKLRLIGFRSDLPSLASLDRISALSATTGFPLFTAGLIFGLIAARLNWGYMFSGDPKELVSLLIWILYAALFHLRLTAGWHGKKPAWLAVALFAVCIFSMTVVNLFAETRHGF
ncbi:MAG: cytochrome c biogenesis protein CcsA [Desulfovibrionaceae bacterium]|nr:cytochrome c biogenesis protein CcsA [Desulfovibrionaceae bacterium]